MTHSSARTYLCVFTVCLLSTPLLHAEHLGIDRFTYQDGPMDGVSGGTFWDWDNVRGEHAYVKSSWSVAGTPRIIGDQLVTQDERATRPFIGEDGGLITEALGAINEINGEKTVYVKVEATTGSLLPSYFGISVFDFSSERLFWGKAFNENIFSIQVPGQTDGESIVAVQPDTTYTLVAKLDYPGDEVRLYVNPDLSQAEGTATAVAAYSSTFWTTRVSLASGAGDPVRWDNLVVATTWEELNSSDTGNYYFLGKQNRFPSEPTPSETAISGKVLNEAGVPLDTVAGVAVDRVVETERAVEFHFADSLEFDYGDRLYFIGTKPVRLIVDGDISLPAGSVASASSGAWMIIPGYPDGLGAGGAFAGAGSAGGHPGWIWPSIWTEAYIDIGQSLFNGNINQGNIPLLQSMYDGLVAANPTEYVSLPGEGGTGAAAIGASGEPGRTGGAAFENGSWGSDPNDSTEEIPIRTLPDGVTGVIGGLSASGADGGAGFGATQAAAGGWGVFGGQETPAILPFFYGSPFVTSTPIATGGTGGTPGADGLVNLDGGPGNDGEDGVDGWPGAYGNHGRGGIYESSDATAPVLRGGGGGGGGSGGGGGEGAGAGGSGGGGGGGGRYSNGLNLFLAGGNGGRGGFGEPGGEGGAGRPGAAGGAGAGAFDLTATGSIFVGGRLEAEGADGQSADRTPNPGETPEYPASLTAGQPGQPGVPDGSVSGGTGGRGGDGGQGGSGGPGGGGGHGGGGAGGTITLHADSVTFGSGHPDNHLFVAGGSGGSGGAPFPSTRPEGKKNNGGSFDGTVYGFGDGAQPTFYTDVLLEPPVGYPGDQGTAHVLLTPSFHVSPTELSVEFTRFASAPQRSFTVTNAPDSPTALTVRPRSTLLWVRFSPEQSAPLAPGASAMFEVFFQTGNAGGGTYNVPITVAPADLNSPAQVSVALNITVNGPTDDYGNDAPSAHPVDFGAGSEVRISGTLETVGDQDWFEFPIGASSNYVEIITRGGTDTSGYLHDGNAGFLVSDEDIHVQNPNFELRYLFTDSSTGKAYIAVNSDRGDTGDYDLVLRLSGTVPDAESSAYIERVNGVETLFLSGRQGDGLRILGSNDGERWQYASTNVFTIAPGITSIPFTDLDLFSRYTVISDEAQPYFLAKVQGSSSANNSAIIEAQTAGFQFTVGSPALNGRTTLELDGAPFDQGNSSTFGFVPIGSSIGGSSDPLFLTQTPGNWTDTPPAGFPDGAWLSHTTSGGSPFGGRTSGLVAFRAGGGSFAIASTEERGVSMNGLLLGFAGYPFFSQEPTAPAYFWGTSNFVNSASRRYTALEANLMVGGSSPNAQVVGTRPAYEAGWDILQKDADGNDTFATEGIVTAHVPFTQPFTAVGQVAAYPNVGDNGSLSLGYRGSENFSAYWDAEEEAYRLVIRDLGDLHNGVLLVNSHDPDHVAAMRWEVDPSGTSILVHARTLPLSAGGKRCGFAFAYFPFDSLHFAPDISPDFSREFTRRVGGIRVGGLPPQIRADRGTDAPLQIIQVTNTGDGTLDLTLDEDLLPPWITVLDPPHVLPPGASRLIRVEFNTAGLDEGVYFPRFRFYGGDFLAGTTTLSTSVRIEEAPLVVTTLVDEDNGSSGGAGFSLREAVAASFDGALITFDPALAGGLDDADSTLFLDDIPITDKDITIDASMLVKPDGSVGLTLRCVGDIQHFRVEKNAKATFKNIRFLQGRTPSFTGGAVHCSNSEVIFIQCALEHNAALRGGAVMVINGSLVMDQCLVAGNQTSSESSLTGTITGAVAQEGGGIYLDESTAVISNTTVTDNGADTGSAFYVSAGSSLTLQHVTLVENWGNGAALATFGSLSILNSIATANTPDDFDVNGPATELGDNYYGQNPKLAPLGDYGGPTRSMPPLFGSPAVEGGVLVTPAPPARDQRDNARTLGLAPDLGAVEAFNVARLNLPSTDGDLIPDALEGAGKPFPHLDPAVDNSTVDSDLDGFTDGVEFYLYTDMFDAASAFRIEDFEIHDDGDENRFLSFRFPSIPGEVYLLQIGETADFATPQQFLLQPYTYNADETVPHAGTNGFIRLQSFAVPLPTPP